LFSFIINDVKVKKNSVGSLQEISDTRSSFQSDKGGFVTLTDTSKEGILRFR
jgi:hypothetical protein